MTDLAKLTEQERGAYLAQQDFLENKEKIFKLRKRLYNLRVLTAMSNGEKVPERYLLELEKECASVVDSLEAVESKGYCVNWNLADCM